VASFASISAALKIQYPWKEMLEDWYKNQPLLNWLPKRTDFYGRNQSVSIAYGAGGGVSHTFADAQAAEDQENSYGEFSGITRVTGYALIYLDGEAIEAAEGQGAAYLQTKKHHIKACATRLSMQLGREIVGSGSGSIGQIATGGITGNALTLGTTDDIVNYEIGMRLTFSTADGGGTERGGTPGYCTVSAVNRKTGVVTVSDITDVTGVAVADYIFPKGNYDGAVEGLKSYLDNTGTPAALWSLTRTADVTRLAGYYSDVSAYGPAEGIKRALAEGARENIYPDVVWVNHTQFLNIELDLAAKAIREPVKIGEWGYDSLVVHSGGRAVRIMADPNIATADAFALTQNVWCFHTLKKMPRFLTYGAGKDIIKPTADGLELRLGYRGQTICRMPGANIRMTLAT
jgi:hypothetical protein